MFIFIANVCIFFCLNQLFDRKIIISMIFLFFTMINSEKYKTILTYDI